MKQNWEIKKLGDICENLDSKRVPITKSSRVAGDIPYYGASGIVDYVGDYIFNEDLLCVSEDGANLIARTYPIAFSISGKTWVNNHAHVLKFSNIITQKLVELYLNSIKLDDYVSGMAQPKLNQTMLNRIPIPIPPLAEQERIVSILDKAFSVIEEAKQNAEKNLKNAKELFDSYLSNFFTNKGDDWEVKKLGEVLTIERGGSPRPIDKYITTDLDGFNWIKISDATASNKYIYETKEKISKEGLHKTRLVIEGDFILSNSMSFGRPYIMKTTGCIHDGWLVLRQDKNISFNTEFLYYLLSSPYVFQQFNNLAAGSTVRNLNIALVSSVLVPIPPIKEQEKIVQKLNVLSMETKQLEKIYQQKLIELEDLKKSILQKAFNGELV